MLYILNSYYTQKINIYILLYSDQNFLKPKIPLETIYIPLICVKHVSIIVCSSVLAWIFSICTHMIMMNTER